MKERRSDREAGVVEKARRTVQVVERQVVHPHQGGPLLLQVCRCMSFFFFLLPSSSFFFLFLLLFILFIIQTDEPIKRIPLKEVKACRHESADARLPARFPFYFSVETDGRVFVISARNESERNEWCEAISKLLPSFNQKPVLPSTFLSCN
jgi:hypothetical protein